MSADPGGLISMAVSGSDMREQEPQPQSVAQLARGPYRLGCALRRIDSTDDRAQDSSSSLSGHSLDESPAHRYAGYRPFAPLTLAQLAATIAVLGLLGLIATRSGLSPIPAYALE